MCDTMVALGSATVDGSVIFAKNSDRSPNEAHELVLIPTADHPADAMTDCTYVTVPQAAHTFALLLAKPFWIWGAEMGANEHGVVIGNEAVFTRVPYEREPGLIGMDLLRLALERASTATEALRVITELLEQYGQGGNCGFGREHVYHNSFLIADTQEAWVLETAGRHWVAEAVVGARGISNTLTIGNRWDLASADVIDYAVEQGWCADRTAFDFARSYAEAPSLRQEIAHRRQCRAMDRLRAEEGHVTIATMMSILRDHGSTAGVDWSPGPGLDGADICMHASWEPHRLSQTTGSMVSHLAQSEQTHWLTGTAAPCTGIFKPVWQDAGLPDTGPAPTGRFDEATLWWRHEVLHRAVLRDYAARLGTYRVERDALEAEFIRAAENVRGAGPDKRAAVSQACFSRANAALAEWTMAVTTLQEPKRPLTPHDHAWQAYDLASERNWEEITHE
jgi:secernin